MERQWWPPVDVRPLALKKGSNISPSVESNGGTNWSVCRIAANEKLALFFVPPAIKKITAPHYFADHTPVFAQAKMYGTCADAENDVPLLIVSCAAVTGLLLTVG